LSTLLSLAANGRAFRIVDTGAEVEAAGMVLFDAIWTVELLVVEY
jgi:hypothetical protein